MGAVKMFQHLQAGDDRAGWMLGKEHLDVALAVAMNVEEAQEAESREEIIQKYGVAQKGIQKSRYWLRVMMRSEIASEQQFASLLEDANELYAALTSIIRNAKRS